MLTSLLLLATAEATSLPYLEYLGNIQTSGCDSQWDGDCESGWGGWGASNSVEMVQASVDSNVYGVKIEPGSGAWNGIWREFTVSGGDYVRWRVNAIVLDGGTADLGIRVVFKNSSGVNIGTQTFVADDIENFGFYEHWFLAPNNAVSARVFMGSKDASSSGIGVVLSNHDCFLLGMGGCGGQSPWGGDIEDWSDLECTIECPSCTISCPNGTLVNDCSVDLEECTMTDNGCYCEQDTSEDDEDFTKISFWM